MITLENFNQTAATINSYSTAIGALCYIQENSTESSIYEGAVTLIEQFENSRNGQYFTDQELQYWALKNVIPKTVKLLRISVEAGMT